MSAHMRGGARKPGQWERAPSWAQKGINAHPEDRDQFEFRSRAWRGRTPSGQSECVLRLRPGQASQVTQTPGAPVHGPPFPLAHCVSAPSARAAGVRDVLIPRFLRRVRSAHRGAGPTGCQCTAPGLSQVSLCDPQFLRDTELLGGWGSPGSSGATMRQRKDLRVGA